MNWTGYFIVNGILISFFIIFFFGGWLIARDCVDNKSVKLYRRDLWRKPDGSPYYTFSDKSKHKVYK